MPRMTVKLVEETLRKEVQKLDKRVQVLGVKQGKKKDAYRVTLLKDGRSGSAELKKAVILLLALYAGSLGPFIKISQVTGGALNPDRLMNTFFRPHFSACYYSESYFNYMDWWFRLGGYSSLGSHQEYRHFWENRTN